MRRIEEKGSWRTYGNHKAKGPPRKLLRQYVDAEGVLVTVQPLFLEQSLKRKSGVFLISDIRSHNKFPLGGIDLLLAEIGYSKLHNPRRSYVLQ